MKFQTVEMRRYEKYISHSQTSLRAVPDFKNLQLLKEENKQEVLGFLNWKGFTSRPNFAVTTSAQPVYQT